jgi:hypothetical protein
MSEQYISSREQLSAALASAKGGETLLLAPGSYGRLNIYNRLYTADVTVKPQVSDGSVKFSFVDIRDTHNLLLEGLDVGRSSIASEGDWGKMVSIERSKNISIDRSYVHGSVDGNPKNDGWGVFVRDTVGFTLTGSRLTELNKGVVVHRSEQVDTSNNLIHNIRMDGFNFASSSGVRILNNEIRDFFPLASDHPDAIQFFTTAQTRGSSDILITGNRILQGAGHGVQGIFMRDEVGDKPYENVVINNNLIYGNDLWHGITIFNGKGASITYNTVISTKSDSEYMWIKVKDVTGALIDRNVADDIIIDTGVSRIGGNDNIMLRTDARYSDLLPQLIYPTLTDLDSLVIPNYGFAPLALGGDVNDIFGTVASESIVGTVNADRIFGVDERSPNAGRNSVDYVWGGDGQDIFALGDSRGAFYDDGSVTASGRRDYLQIKDFDDMDAIQLVGRIEDYVFRRETVDGMAGTAILIDTNKNGAFDKQDELIGHVANVSLDMARIVFVENQTGITSSNIGGVEYPARLNFDSFAIT